MKIGILTYQRAENYGAMLQAFALKKYLENLGYIAEMIDYWPDYHANHFKIFSHYSFQQRSLVGKFYYFLLLVWSYKWMKKRQDIFRHFMQRFLGLKSKPEYTTRNTLRDEYDIVVYGSDQIWRKQPFSEFQKFDELYFGTSQIKASRKIAFAASMGPVHIQKGDDFFFKEYLNNFNNISVRESELKIFLENIGFTVTQVLDPVFLLTKYEWEKLVKNKAHKMKGGGYILFYNLLNTKESRKLVYDISKKTGYKIKELCKIKNFKVTSPYYIKSAGVEEFLSLIKEAEIVLSNSFHGIAMSLIFQKQFFAIGMRHKAGRVLSLLQLLGIEERYIADDSINIPKSFIDYKLVELKIDTLKKHSTSFLRKVLDY